MGRNPTPRDLRFDGPTRTSPEPRWLFRHGRAPEPYAQGIGEVFRRMQKTRGVPNPDLQPTLPAWLRSVARLPTAGRAEWSGYPRYRPRLRKECGQRLHARFSPVRHGLRHRVSARGRPNVREWRRDLSVRDLQAKSPQPTAQAPFRVPHATDCGVAGGTAG